MPARRPDPVRLVLATAIALTGAVWMAQGLGVPIGGSFMVGDPRWTAIGGALIVLAGIFALREFRRP